MKDVIEATDCPICSASPRDLKCTLHGGHMTATEVELRHKYTVSGDQWVEWALADPAAPICDAMIERTLEILRKKGMLPKPPA